MIFGNILQITYSKMVSQRDHLTNEYICNNFIFILIEPDSEPSSPQSEPKSGNLNRLINAINNEFISVGNSNLK